MYAELPREIILSWSYLTVFKEIRYCRNYFRNRDLRCKFRLKKLNLVKFIQERIAHSLLVYFTTKIKRRAEKYTKY